jgi:hypothetical protein
MCYPSGRAGVFPKRCHQYFTAMVWKTEPTEKVRAAFPHKYWFHNYDGRPHFMWDDLEVSEAEFRRHAHAERLTRVDEASKRKSS